VLAFEIVQMQHRREWAVRLARCATEAEARAVLLAAVDADAASVSRLDLHALPQGLAGAFAAFVASGVCERALNTCAPHHPLRGTFTAIARQGLMLLASDFVPELSRAIAAHAAARDIVADALARARASY
jgi:hypothetical protein